MFGTEWLNARQLASALGVSYTTLFKLLKVTNSSGNHCPFHQMTRHSRKYYSLDEVKNWLKN